METGIDARFRPKSFHRFYDATAVVQDGFIDIEGVLRLLTVCKRIQLEHEERADFAHFDGTSLLAAEHVGAGD